MTEAIRFGTDGWRDIIADRFTFENVARAAQAHAQMLKRAGGTSVVVGHDTRFHSDRFARVVAEVMAANGLKTWLSRSFLPTPALSFAVVHFGAAGGVMVTASHNPPSYNGYKIKGPYGGSSTPQIVQAVEEELAQLEEVAVFDPAQHRIETFDIEAAYFAQLERVLDMDVLRAFKGVMYHDAMGGAGAGWLAAFVEKAGLPVELRPLRGAPNPMFYGVNPEPIPSNLQEINAALAIESDPVFAAITDGDADRIGAVLAGNGTADGVFFNSHQIFAVLLQHLVGRGLRGRVVKTFSGSRIIDKLCALHGLDLLETPIGFKYITDAFLEGQSDAQKTVLMGGEESGGMACLGHIPERDGILNAMLMLEAVAKSGKGLGALFAEIEGATGMTHAYDRVDLHLDANFDKGTLMERLQNGVAAIAGFEIVEIQTKDGVKWLLRQGNSEAWVLFRASGTEPVVRVYSEAANMSLVQAILDRAVALVKGV